MTCNQDDEGYWKSLMDDPPPEELITVLGPLTVSDRPPTGKMTHTDKGFEYDRDMYDELGTMELKKGEMDD